MHQIRFRLGLRRRPRWGAYSAPPDTLAGFKELTSKGKRGGREERRKGRGVREGSGEGEKREGRGKQPQRFLFDFIPDL